MQAQDLETVMAMIHPDDIPAFHKGQALAEETGSALLEYRQKTKSGDYRWISNHLIIIRDTSGSRCTGMVTSGILPSKSGQKRR